MHSSMHCWHIAIVASSIAIMTGGDIPCMRIMPRIIVLHMSAAFMHAGAHDIICVEHTVQACSHAEQASIHACITDMSIMSIPGIDFMSLDIMSIIIESIPRLASVRVLRRVTRAAARACRHGMPAGSRTEDPARLSRVPSHAVTPPRPHPLAAALVVVLAALVSLLSAASPAHAHDELLSSDPAAGANLESLPDALTLTFSGALSVDEGASEVAVTDASGATLTDGPPAVADTVLTQPLSGTASGVVTVLWKVVSSDGHPISGEFTFSVAGSPTPTPTPTPTATPAESASPTDEPTETASPTAAPVDEGASGDVWPWVIGGILLAAVAGAVIYLLTSRARREKALAAGQDPQASGPRNGGTDDPLDR